MLSRIAAEITRLNAAQVQVAPDDEFEPEAGELLLVQIEDMYWHLLPEHFLDLLRSLPDGAGSAAVHQAIEAHAHAVWHGPSPKDSRDT